MKNHQIRTLLDLHGQVIDQEDGFWVKIDAWEVAASAEIPHAIRYSLTLHAPDGTRILGYDNAHAPKNPTKYANRTLPYDHRHRSPSDLGIRYEYKNAYQLLIDFFVDVDKALNLARE